MKISKYSKIVIVINKIQIQINNNNNKKLINKKKMIKIFQINNNV